VSKVQATIRAGGRLRPGPIRMDAVPRLALLAGSLPFSGLDLPFLLGGGLVLAGLGLVLYLAIRRHEPAPDESVPAVERVGVEAERVNVEA
jgi:hypothetical protein